jgi:hypothetical protein
MEVKTITYTRNFLGNFYHHRFGSMDDHMAAMLQEGWEPLNSAQDTGHIKVGATLGAALFTGGLSLLGGASRTNSEISITYKKA